MQDEKKLIEKEIVIDYCIVCKDFTELSPKSNYQRCYGCEDDIK